uniref:Uncharacterized protein n=1 Tax=Strigamia maritima TaxID=126957 RepID=T1JLL8_STRMM
MAELLDSNYGGHCQGFPASRVSRGRSGWSSVPLIGSRDLEASAHGRICQAVLASLPNESRDLWRQLQLVSALHQR